MEPERRFSADEAARLVLTSMGEEDRARCAVLVDDRVYVAGEALPVSGEPRRADSDTIVVFVDERPSMNWGHPCHYLLFDAATHEVIRIDSQFPPWMSGMAASFRMVWRPPGSP